MLSTLHTVLRRLLPWLGLVLVVGAGCQPAAPPTSAAPRAPLHATSGSRSAMLAPTWALPDLDGKTQRLEDFRGRVILLNFWATWCPPCREEIPDLIKLHTAYHDRGVTVIGVSLNTGSRSAITSFAKGFGITYPIVLGDYETADAYHVSGIPTSFLIDAEGRLVKRWTGPYPLDAFAEQIDALLASSGGP